MPLLWLTLWIILEPIFTQVIHLDILDHSWHSSVILGLTFEDISGETDVGPFGLFWGLIFGANKWQMNILETSQNEHTACKAKLEESKVNASQLEGEKTELSAAVEAGKALLEESKANASQLGLALLQVQQVRLAPLDLFAHLLTCRSSGLCLLFPLTLLPFVRSIFACCSRPMFLAL
jgi:hypothetical protein